MDKKIIRIRNISPDIHTALKKRAIDENMSMEALVLTWIVEQLKKGGRPHKDKKEVVK